jgi:peptidoglycan/xylan/chitin deacetylase (PgdA/CDA1 family)
MRLRALFSIQSICFCTALLGCGLVLLPVAGAAEQLLNLPLPADGLRYHSLSEIEFRWPATHAAGSVCLWGDDRFSAVSFTIDDNNAPDFPFWRQASQDYGWKFTWFVIVHPYMWDIYKNVPGTSTGYFGTAAQFKTLYDEGHEVELHGWCGVNSFSDAAYEKYVLLSKTYLESVISNNITTFAYPCSNTSRDGETNDSFRTIIGNHLIAARGGVSHSVVRLAKVDYLTIPSIGPALGPPNDLGGQWPKLDETGRTIKSTGYRGWAVVLNHKIQDKPATIALLNWVKTNELAGKFWVKPFSHVARYAQERDSSTLTVTSVTPSKIEFTLTDRMRDDLFNVPLTVKFRVNGWTAAAARQNGVSVPVRLVTTNGATYALVDAVPDHGPVALRALAPDTEQRTKNP